MEMPTAFTPSSLLNRVTPHLPKHKPTACSQPFQQLPQSGLPAAAAGLYAAAAAGLSAAAAGLFAAAAADAVPGPAAAQGGEEPRLLVHLVSCPLARVNGQYEGGHDVG